MGNGENDFTSIFYLPLQCFQKAALRKIKTWNVW